MAINKKLLHFVSKANFSTQLANSNIDSKSIVFIKDTGEIWTHDKLYSCASWGTNQTNYVPLTIGGTSYNISKDGHTHSYLPISGGTLTGDLEIFASNTDKFIKFTYNTTDAYAWRIGYLGTGAGNENRLAFQSAKTSGASYTDALSFGLDDLVGRFAVTPTVGNTKVSLEGHTHSNFTRTAAGFTPAPTTNTTTRYLREDGTWAIPPNTPDTHWTTGIRAGASETNANSVANDPFIKVLDNTTYRSQIQILGGTNITAKSDATGKITIDGTHNHDTVYVKKVGDTMSGSLTATSFVKANVDNSQNYLLQADGGHILKSSFSVSDHTHSYLPLSGGTLTRALTIQSGNDGKIILNNTDTETKHQQITFQQNSTEYGRLGTYGSNDLKWSGNTIWHSGNDGSGSGLDADLLDGLEWSNYNLERLHTINASSLDKTKFYPIFFSGDVYNLLLEIYSPGGIATAEYNTNRFRAVIYSRGWDDSGEALVMLSRYNYQDTEITIGAIGFGQVDGGIAVWVRGGMNYTLRCNRTPSLKTSNYTYGTEIYTVGTNFYGGTNTKVSIEWQNNADRAKYDVALISSNVASATKLQTARTINGTSFSGSSNIVTSYWGTARTIGIVNSDGTGTAVGVSVNGASNVNLKLPSTITATISGNASSATYASAVTLTADNATNATRYPLFASAATGNLSPRTDTGFTYNPSTGALTSTNFIGNLTGNANTANYLSYNGTTDLNAVTNTGVYRQEQPSSGYPYTSTLNMRSSDGRQQLTISRDGSGMKFRGVNSGSGTTGWTAWKEVYHSGNFTNLNQLTTRNFSDLQNKPTTLSGYGITDALFTEQVVVAQTDDTWVKSYATSKNRALVYNTSGVEWGYLFNFRNEATYGTVLATSYSNNTLKMLSRNAGTWSSWVTFLHSGNFSVTLNGSSTTSANFYAPTSQLSVQASTNSYLIGATSTTSLSTVYSNAGIYMNGSKLFTGSIQASGNITASTFIGSLSGNASSATTSTSANRLNRLGDNRGSFSPSAIAGGSLVATFSTQGALVNQVNNSNYSDVIAISTYQDISAGQVNALSFDKSSYRINHFMGTFGASTWSGFKTLAYLTDNVASATKLQTARTIWGQSFNGTGNVDGLFTINYNNAHRATGLEVVSIGSESSIGFALGSRRGVVGQWSSGLNMWSSKVGVMLSANIDTGNVLIGTTTDAGYKLYVNGAIGTNQHIRAGGYISAGEASDNNYGWINVTRTASIENASYFSMVRAGNVARGFGISTDNSIIIGSAAGNRTISDIYLKLSSQQVTTTKAFSSSNRIFTGFDSGQANSMSCSNWFRSGGDTGWFNNTYGGGIYQDDATYVKVYGSKAFKVTSTASDSINTDGGIKASGSITTSSGFINTKYSADAVLLAGGGATTFSGLYKHCCTFSRGNGSNVLATGLFTSCTLSSAYYYDSQTIPAYPDFEFAAELTLTFSVPASLPTLNEATIRNGTYKIDVTSYRVGTNGFEDRAWCIHSIGTNSVTIILAGTRIITTPEGFIVSVTKRM